MYHPSRGANYTLKQIMDELILRDAPFLMVYAGPPGSPIKSFQPIQLSHFIPRELLAVKEWADSEWTYKHETEEWIPIFHFNAGVQPSINHLLDIKVSKHADEDGESAQCFIAPKMFPREEY